MMNYDKEDVDAARGNEFLAVGHYRRRSDNFMAEMSVPRISADFNGLEASPRDADRLAVALDTIGSLRDLTNIEATGFVKV
jgi:hypothetical protein